MKKILVLVSFLFAFATYALAQTPLVNQRQENQQQRIKQGVVSGELTKAETANAVQDQRHIRREERRAKSDGVVTRRERKKLQREQNQASHELYRDKHDRQQKPRAK